MKLYIRFALVLAIALGAFQTGFAQMGSMLRNDGGAAEFISTWNTTLTSAGSTGNNVIQLPLPATGNYAFSVDWGDGSTGAVTNSTLANATHTYAASGVYTIVINGLIDGWQFNNSGDRTKIIEVSQWGRLRNAGNGAFYGCSNLTVTALDQLNVNGITNFSNQFRGCSSLTTMDVSNWNVSAGTNFSGQFRQCSSLTTLDVSNWDLSSGTNFEDHFSFCSSLISLDVRSWDLGMGINFTRQFFGCSSLPTLDVSNWDMSSADILSNQFRACTIIDGLDVSNWDVSNVRAFDGQFANCSNLSSLDVSSWNTGTANWMFDQFSGCTSLTTLAVAGWNTSNVINFDGQFAGCTGLTSLPVNNWNVSGATRFQTMFANCTGIQSQLNFSNWDVSEANVMNAFLSGIALTPANYAATLAQFAQPRANGGLKDSSQFPIPGPLDPIPGFIDFGNSQYPGGSTADRSTIIARGWTLTDGGAL